jgi:hypothetical protein
MFVKFLFSLVESESSFLRLVGREHGSRIVGVT